MTTPPDAINPPETRWCVRCGVEKPLDREHFGGRFRRDSTDFAHHCKDCGVKGKHRKVSPIQDGRDWS